MRYVQILYVLALAVVLGALAPCAQAVSLPVLNPSFEADNLPLDDDFTFTPANWTGASQREGAINENEAGFPGALDAGTPIGADGTNVAFISGNSAGNNGKMSQDIVSSVELGHTYTLTVAIGYRFGRQALDDWRIGLYEPGFASQFAERVGLGIDLTQGEFLDFSTSFTAGVGDVGKQLMVYLEAANVPAGNGVTYFDNIRLTHDAIDNADFDGNGDIDGIDFLIWQRGFGIGTTLAEGDANNSGTVDALDLAVWEDQYGTTSLLSITSAAVPEPTSLLLISLGGMLMLNSISRKTNR